MFRWIKNEWWFLAPSVFMLCALAMVMGNPYIAFYAVFPCFLVIPVVFFAALEALRRKGPRQWQDFIALVCGAAACLLFVAEFVSICTCRVPEPGWGYQNYTLVHCFEIMNALLMLSLGSLLLPRYDMKTFRYRLIAAGPVVLCFAILLVRNSVINFHGD